VVSDVTRIALPLSVSGKSFQSPIGNRSYPDDTLIVLEYEDDDEGTARLPAVQDNAPSATKRIK
jgi:hypothetical protein